MQLDAKIPAFGADLDLVVMQSGTTCTIRVKGPLKFGPSQAQFEKAVDGAMNTGHVFLVLNLEAMPVIDSSGIGAVVNTLLKARKLGGDAKLVNPSPFATKTFQLTHLYSMFSVFATEAEALEACT